MQKTHSGPQTAQAITPGLGASPELGATFRTLRRVGILGIGSYAPDRVLTNHDLEQMVDTSDEWIATRTGMRERRIAAPGQATSDLSVEAARRALAGSGIAPEDVELIVVATVTPDHLFPPTACLVQTRLGAQRAAGFDLSAACSGFVNALSVAHSLVGSGAYDNALVIGAEMLSAITDYEDRESCILFGDGAGAVVLGPDPHGRDPASPELLDHAFGMDGSGADLIAMQAGGSRFPASSRTVDERLHYLRMQGRKVYRFAVQKMAEVVEEIAARNGHTVEDIDLLVPHQANLRILEAVGERLGMRMDRVFVNIERYGNTSSASIPLALDQAVAEQRVRSGDLVCLVTFGGGLTWGASLLRW